MNLESIHIKLTSQHGKYNHGIDSDNSCPGQLLQQQEGQHGKQSHDLYSQDKEKSSRLWRACHCIFIYRRLQAEGNELLSTSMPHGVDHAR